MYFSLPSGNEIELRTYFLTKNPKQTNKQTNIPKAMSIKSCFY